jgi:hypothetical protein
MPIQELGNSLLGALTGLTLETHMADTRKDTKYLESLSTVGGVHE